MRAIEIKNQSLCLSELPVPTPGPGEVLIKVAYAGLNRADIMQRKGLYPPPAGASPLPGLEVSGQIAALGAGVSTFSVGDNVCAVLSGGGYAEYCTAPAGQALPIPQGMNIRTAAAVPEAFFTVWLSIVEQGEYKKGEKVLVHGGTSGIGTTAIQLMKALGAEIYTTAGTEEKCTVCTELGARLAVNYKTQDFVSEIKNFTGGYGVDVILDITGGDNVPKNIELLAPGGRMVFIALIRGRKGEVDFAQILLKRLKLIGSTLRSRTAEHKATIAQALYKEAWPLMEKGMITPIIDSEFTLEDAAKAHARMEEGLHIGKILLKI